MIDNITHPPCTPSRRMLPAVGEARCFSLPSASKLFVLLAGFPCFVLLSFPVPVLGCAAAAFPGQAPPVQERTARRERKESAKRKANRPLNLEAGPTNRTAEIHVSTPNRQPSTPALGILFPR